MTAFRFATLVALVFSAATLTSCGEEESTASSADSNAPSLDAYWASEAPTGRRGAKDVRANAKDGEEVVVEGRAKDFIDDRAVFTMVDVALQHCRQTNGDLCATPWDYCCIASDEQTLNTVTIEIQDETGRPLRASLKGSHGLDHLQMVAATGTVKRDEAGNVTIITTSLTSLE